MSLSPVRIVAFTFLATFAGWGLILLGPGFEARVESKDDTVEVRQRSGLWFHKYTITVRRLGDRATVSSGRTDSIAPQRISLRATEAQYDALRTGRRLKIHQLPLVSSFAWIVEESVILGALKALGARTVRFQNPRSVQPALGRSSGLARVLSVHRVSRQRGVLESTGAGTPNTAFDVVVVEFWAVRLRTLVRTADVVDARSIDDLGPGQILQMHYDPLTPRVMRLDDGMRTFQP